MKEFNIKELMDNTPYVCALVDWTNEVTHYVLSPDTIQKLLQQAAKTGYDQALKDFQDIKE